jgi:tetratricopeptide (TPR) repeat protein
MQWMMRVGLVAIASLAAASTAGWAQAAIGASQSRAGAFPSLAAKAAAARDADKLDEAVSLFRKALALRPSWAEGWWSLGTIEYDRNEYASAAHDLERVLPLAPKDGTARVMLGLCEFELDQDKAALLHLQQGLDMGLADDAQLQEVALYHEGVLLQRAGQYKLAQATFGAVCKADSESGPVLDGLGESVLRLAPQQAPVPGSENAAVLRRIGHAACHGAMKKYDDANREYAELLSTYPDFPNLHYAYGLSLVESKEIAQAVEQFKLQIAADEKNVAARLEIAATLYKVDSAAALPYARQAVALNPQLPFAHYLLGLLLLDTDDYAKAIPELEIAAKAFPKEKKVFFALGSAYARAGRRQDAANARAAFGRLNAESAAETTTY